MATSYSVGHGMRRRSGIPSSYTETTGTAMARAHKTSDEAYSDAAAAGSVRVPIAAATAAPALEGTLVAKKNVQASDPTAGGKANRKNIENIGASYHVQPKTTFVQLDPAAGPTMASARIVPSVQGRVNPGFDSAIQSATL
jgi:hypothetical protein